MSIGSIVFVRKLTSAISLERLMQKLRTIKIQVACILENQILNFP